MSNIEGINKYRPLMNKMSVKAMVIDDSILISMLIIVP